MNITPLEQHLNPFGKKSGGIHAYLSCLFGEILVFSAAFTVVTVAQTTLPTSVLLAMCTPMVWVGASLSAAWVITLLHFRLRFALALIILGTAGFLATLELILISVHSFATLL